MLNFNLFGIPMVGADICGFLGNTNVELCARWQELGAFYPFSRNHNEEGTVDQDPPFMGSEVIQATLYSLRIRYALMPLMYTEFYKSNEYGSPVIRSLPLEFAHDPLAEHVDTQFLWGRSVMIAPVVHPDVRSLKVYFPAGRWYRYVDLELLSETSAAQTIGEHVTLDVPLDEIVVAVRGGSVLATQHPEINTAKTRRNPYRLLIALDEHHVASGDLFWDDGDTPDPVLTGEYNYVQFTFNNVRNFKFRLDFSG